jgi:hypothetical protein
MEITVPAFGRASQYRILGLPFSKYQQFACHKLDWCSNLLMRRAMATQGGLGAAKAMALTMHYALLAVLFSVLAPGQARESASTLRAASDTNAQKEIKDLERSRYEAILRGDSALIERTTADDFTLTKADGTVATKADLVNALKSGSVKYQTVDESELQVRLYGNTAVVTGRSTANAARGVITGDLRFTRVYVHHNGVWQVVSSQQTSVMVTVVAESAPDSCPVTYKPAAGGGILDFGTTRAERRLDAKTYEFVCECTPKSKSSKVVDCTQDTTVSFTCKR